jgi:hypothetical protein
MLNKSKSKIIAMAVQFLSKSLQLFSNHCNDFDDNEA